MPLPDAHPAFLAHFTDPVYDDPGADLGPFGNDEGWDLVMDGDSRRDELGPDSTLATVLGHDDVLNVAGPMVGVDGIETAHFVVGAAFTLLRLTGQLSGDDRAVALLAVGFLIDYVDPEREGELVVQRDDLLTWRNPS